MSNGANFWDNLSNIFGFGGLNQSTQNQVNQVAANKIAAPEINTAGTTDTDLSPTTDSGFGWNMDTMKFALGALNSLGQLWGANKAYGLAKDQFNFTKDVTNTNLNNSIMSYNTALSDRSYARAAMEGRDAASAQAYIDENRMTRG